MEEVSGISRPKNILQVEPENELCFRGNFTEVVTTHMKLINPSDHKVCFKVKTTAPRRYCVRPNNGILSPRSSVDVVLRLQPLDKPDSENTKHKFMVQSLLAPSEDINSLDKLWRSATNDQLMYIKLKCVFETLEGIRLSNEDINIVTSPNVHPNQPSEYEVRNGPVNDEIRRIRADVESLRLENKKLKIPKPRNDSEKHLRKLTTRASQKLEAQVESSRTKSEVVYPSFVYIVVALLIGLFVGKFIL